MKFYSMKNLFPENFPIFAPMNTTNISLTDSQLLRVALLPLAKTLSRWN